MTFCLPNYTAVESTRLWFPRSDTPVLPFVNAFASRSWTIYKFENCRCTPYGIKKTYRVLEHLEDENRRNSYGFSNNRSNFRTYPCVFRTFRIRYRVRTLVVCEVQMSWSEYVDDFNIENVHPQWRIKRFVAVSFLTFFFFFKQNTHRNTLSVKLFFIILNCHPYSPKWS